MKRRALFGLLAVSLLLLGCVNSAFNLNSAVNNCKQCGIGGCGIISDCLINQTSSAQDCAMLDPNQGADVYKPNNILGVDFQISTECTLHWALLEKNATICLNSTTPTDCVQGYALHANDSSSCNLLANSTSCVTNFAESKNDPESCNTIQSDTGKVSCYASFLAHNGYGNCKENFQQYLRLLNCELSLFNPPKNLLASENSGICATFNEATGQPLEEGRCAAVLALANENASFCDRAKGVKSECYLVLAQISKNVTLATCDKAGVGYVPCYRGLAIQTKDSSICQKFVPASWQDQCYDELALATENLSICTQITSWSDAAYCACDISSKECPDSNNCNLTKQDCASLQNVTSKGGGMACVPNPDNCYYGIGIQNTDIDACNHIANTQARQQCLDIIAHSK